MAARSKQRWPRQPPLNFLFALEALEVDWKDGNVFVLWGPHGLGRTTMMRAAHDEYGGAFLDMADYLAELGNADPMAIKETLTRLLRLDQGSRSEEARPPRKPPSAWPASPPGGREKWTSLTMVECVKDRSD